MNTYFPRIITMLRKERGLSQKQAAEELGISQALLSHYEKGIRECGLDFICKAADYYDVSCDYLLGRSPHRGSEPTSPQNAGQVHRRHSAVEQINRGLIVNSLSVLYSLLAKIANRKLTVNVSTYLFIAIYRLFRRIYSVSDKNPQDIFTLPEGLYRGYSLASMERLYTDIEGQTELSSDNSYLDAYIHSTDGTPLTEEYPEQSISLFKIIEHAENTISKSRR